MNERQTVKEDRCFVLNNRDTQRFGQDLAARQTLQGSSREGLGDWSNWPKRSGI